MELDDGELRILIGKVVRLDTKRIHGDIGEEMVAIIEDRFDNSVDPSGVPWAPIKDYVARLGNIKRKRVKGDPPLKLGLGSPPLARSFEFDASPQDVVIGTPVPYAKFFSDFPDNNQARRTTQKKREFMGLESDSDIDRIVGVVDDVLRKIIK